MITLSSTFDMVHDVTAVFRALLEAMANPGREVGWPVPEAPMLSAAVTLLDGETTFYWEAADETAASIRFLTGSREVGMEDADFLFLQRPERKEQALGAAKWGTHEDPHRSGTVLAPAQGEMVSVRLAGPGVKPGSVAEIPEDILEWMDCRDKQMHEFPCGVDMIFFTRQGVIAIPRTTKRGRS